MIHLGIRIITGSNEINGKLNEKLDKLVMVLET